MTGFDKVRAAIGSWNQGSNSGRGSSEPEDFISITALPPNKNTYIKSEHHIDVTPKEPHVD